MPKPDIRRYTLEQIREMNRNGEAQPTPPDAPLYALSEREQEAFREGKPLTLKDPRSIIVELELKPETLRAFERAKDPSAAMAKVLDEAARKAS